MAYSLSRKGFLDSVDADKLDQIDRIVFDAGASEQTRVEALVFFMEHTEGCITFAALNSMV